MDEVESLAGVQNLVTQTNRVNVLLPMTEAERFDAYCRAKGHKKSTLVARLIRDHLDREQFTVQPSLFKAGRG